MMKFLKKYIVNRLNPCSSFKGNALINFECFLADEIVPIEKRKHILAIMKRNAATKTKSSLAFRVYSYINKEIFNSPSEITSRHINLAIKKITKLGNINVSNTIGEINQLIKQAGIDNQYLDQDLTNIIFVEKCFNIMNRHVNYFHDFHSYSDDTHYISDVYLKHVNTDLMMPISMRVDDDSYKILAALLRLHNMEKQIKITKIIGHEPFRVSLTYMAYAKIKRAYSTNDKLLELIKNTRNDRTFVELGYIDMYIKSEDIKEGNKIDEHIQITNMLIDKIKFLSENSSVLLFIKQQYEKGICSLLNKNGYSIKISPYSGSSELPLQFTIKNPDDLDVGVFSGLYEPQDMTEMLILSDISRDSFKDNINLEVMG